MTTPLDTSTILIIDDTPSNLGLVVSLLEGRGYRVSIAQDGEEGRQRAQLVHPDLILLDIMMTGEDGFEICRRLKAQESTRNIPVIFMTALSSTEHKVKGFEAGGVDYVTKPLQIDEVMARVGTHLKLHAAQRQLAAQNALLAQQRDELELRVAERTAELASRERQFRTLAENQPDNLIRYDRQCRARYVNRNLIATLGEQAPDLLGKTPREAYPDGRFDEYQAQIVAVSETGQPGEIEITLPDTGAGLRYHQIRFVAERDEQGEIDGVLAIGRDITERKRLEERLALVDFALDHAMEGAFLLDEQARFHYVNEEACRSLGYSREELLSMELFDIDPDLPREMWPLIWSSTSEKGTGTAQSRHQTRDGRIFPVEVFASYFEFGGKSYNLAMTRDITERKRSESALRESEQRYRLVFENSPVSIWEEDFSAVKTFFDSLRKAGVADIGAYFERHPETVRQCAELVKIIDVNQAALALHEAASKEELFAGLVNTFTPESFDTFREELVFLWNGETGVTRDAAVKTLAGELRHVTVHFGVCPGYEESYAKVLVSLVDITARKLSEDALRESEEKYRTLIQKIQAGVIVHGADTRILIANPVAQEILGLSEEQLLGKAAIDSAWYFFREDGCRVMPDELPVNQVLTSRQALKNCVLGVHRPGSDAKVWCLVNADPVFGKDGEIIQVIVTFIDITQRKYAEQVLAARELEFRTLAENAPNIIMRYDRECRRVYVNPAYERETAIPLQEAVSVMPDVQWAADVTMPVEEYKAALRRAMESGEPVEQLIGWLRRDGGGEPGEIRYHALRIVAERDPEGKVIGALVIGHNITALKEAERKTEEAYQQVQALAARREEVLETERKRIARDMHDELGQYLTAMRMGVSLLRMRFGGSDPDILESVQNVMSLVDRTIQVVRSMATRLRPAPLEMGVVSALEWLAEDFSERTAIACSLDADGRDIDMSDNQATALFRIVQESLTNVARYADAGSVAISLESDGEDFRLRVADDGKGFDPAAPRTKSYGLVGIRERAAMLGGEAIIASVPGQGTTIEIRIPIEEAKGQP